MKPPGPIRDLSKARNPISVAQDCNGSEADDDDVDGHVKSDLLSFTEILRNLKALESQVPRQCLSLYREPALRLSQLIGDAIEVCHGLKKDAARVEEVFREVKMNYQNDADQS